MKLLTDFKNSLDSGETVFGPFMKSLDPAFVEIAGFTGFDFVILDMEHGPVSFENLHNLVRAAQVSGTVPIVRTSDSRDVSISKALDLGAFGVQIPQVQTAGEARECVKAGKYFPLGQRGVCRFVRSAGYSSVPREEYFSRANDTLIILQLEGRKALKNLDEILDVEGFDIIFIGPYDLSQSLGYPGRIDHPEVIGEMKKIVEDAGKRNVTVGTFTDTLASARMWKDTGVQYISYSVDVGIFREACADLIDKLHR